jgi:hypothetical protein
MSKFEDFHAVLHSMQEREKQFLLQHLEGAKLRRQHGGGEVVVPLINLMIKYALEQKAGPDEQALIQRLTQEGRYKSYANTLFHAHRKVLRLLHHCHEDDPKSEVAHLLFVANWMRSRRHLDQLEDMLAQAEEIAQKFEFFQEELEVIEHRQFLYAIQPKKYKIDQLHGRIRELREKRNQADDLLLLADEMQMRKQMLSGQSSPAEAMASPLLQNIKHCKSTRAKLHFLRSWISLHLMALEYDQALACIHDLIGLIQAAPQLLQDPLVLAWHYHYAFAGLQTSIALKRQKDVAFFTSLLEDGKLSVNDPAKYFEYTTRAWLWTADVRETFSEAGAQRFNQIQRQLDKYAPVLGDGADLMISHHVALLHMLAGHPRKAVIWINRNMRNQPGLHRPDLVAFSYVFFVVAKFELGEWDMVERGKRTALTFLQKNKLSNPVFEEILKGLLRCSRYAGKSQFATSLAELHGKIAQLLQEPENAKANHYFDLLAWLDRMSKL